MKFLPHLKSKNRHESSLISHLAVHDVGMCKRFGYIHHQVGRIALQVASFYPPVGKFHEPIPNISERQGCNLICNIKLKPLTLKHALGIDNTPDLCECKNDAD
jgi:hypothetical protein